MRGRLLLSILVAAAVWAWGVGPAQASCDPASVQVSVTPILGPSEVIPVAWRIGPGCAAIETGLLIGRDPTALAPAGQPMYLPGPDFQQDLPVTESGAWWIAAYVRDETGAVGRSAPQMTVVLVPPRLPAGPHGSHGPPPLMEGDAYFLQSAGEPHYASLRRVTETNWRFEAEAYTQGFDTRRLASTQRTEVLAGHAPPLSIGGVAFPVNPADVEAALGAAAAVFAGLGYPRAGLYDVLCFVSARFFPDSQRYGPVCSAVTNNEYFPHSPQWVTYGQSGGIPVGQSIRASLAYFVPKPPVGKQIRSAKLRVYTFVIDDFEPIRLSGKQPVSVDERACFPPYYCFAWVTWDFTEEARALAAQGGGELSLTLDPVPPKTSGYNAGVASWSIGPRVNYPWRHGHEDSSLTITFEEACPRELKVSVTPSLVRPVIGNTLKGEAPNVPTEAIVEAVVKVCSTEGDVADPVEVLFEVRPPAAGSADAGGHLHAEGRRPTGLLQDRDRGQAIDRCTVTTFVDGIGVCTVTYRAADVGGVETILARASGLADAEAKVTVKVPGLVDFSVVQSPFGHAYRLTGRTANHVDNHWATTSTISSAQLLAVDFFEDFSATLGINDVSLSQGGLFDICGAWSTDGVCANAPRGGHVSHRLGTSVDIDRCAASVAPDNPNARGSCPAGFVTVPKDDYIRKACRDRGGSLAKESTIHCEFPR